MSHDAEQPVNDHMCRLPESARRALPIPFDGRATLAGFGNSEAAERADMHDSLLETGMSEAEVVSLVDVAFTLPDAVDAGFMTFEQWQQHWNADVDRVVARFYGG